MGHPAHPAQGIASGHPACLTQFPLLSGGDSDGNDVSRIPGPGGLLRVDLPHPGEAHPSLPATDPYPLACCAPAVSHPVGHSPPGTTSVRNTELGPRPDPAQHLQVAQRVAGASSLEHVAARWRFPRESTDFRQEVSFSSGADVGKSTQQPPCVHRQVTVSSSGVPYGRAELAMASPGAILGF